MRALDKVSDADDDSDVLRSVVGLWTYGDKQVWIMVRPDGSATQCAGWSGLFLEGSIPRPEHSGVGEDLGRRSGRAGEGRDQTDGKIRVFLLQAG
jgi:hypothetical protein